MCESASIRSHLTVDWRADLHADLGNPPLPPIPDDRFWGTLRNPAIDSSWHAAQYTHDQGPQGGRLLDAIEENEQEADPDEPFTADWPRSGRTAYLRCIADAPYVVEVHDGPGTQIVVSVPLDMREEWIAESRERLAAARAALGVGTEDHHGTRP
ncbi:DUF5959 family protein [Streptomyces sp. NPDC056402]|uniref:DUF5959 family protein n=1 Tax=Streptomyces sp. NPDC056402 TaxID=3345810 RepID=UPI0035DDB53D